MRKVTQTIKTAFESGFQQKTGNTLTHSNAVWLHGNKIIAKFAGEVWFSLCGWESRTTNERINGICFNSDHRIGGLYKRNHETFCTFPGNADEVKINPDGWYRVADGQYSACEPDLIPSGFQYGDDWGVVADYWEEIGEINKAKTARKMA